jgi:hypothetical protein
MENQQTQEAFGDTFMIFGQDDTLEDELKAASLAAQTAVAIAQLQYPEHRLGLVVSCLPVEELFGEKIPDRFVGRTQRRVPRSRSPAKGEQCQSNPTDDQKPQNTSLNAV